MHMRLYELYKHDIRSPDEAFASRIRTQAHDTVAESANSLDILDSVHAPDDRYIDLRKHSTLGIDLHNLNGTTFKSELERYRRDEQSTLNKHSDADEETKQAYKRVINHYTRLDQQPSDMHRYDDWNVPVYALHEPPRSLPRIYGNDIYRAHYGMQDSEHGIRHRHTSTHKPTDSLGHIATVPEVAQIHQSGPHMPHSSHALRS